MKKIIYFFLVCVISFFAYIYKEDIAKFLVDNIFTQEKIVSDIKYNDYFKRNSYSFVGNTTDFIVNDRKEILDVFYTILNSGMTDFTFYCSEDYSECINEIDNISNDRALLSNINNFVNTYNSFKDIVTTRYESNGKIEVEVSYLYDVKRRDKIDSKVSEVINTYVNDSMSDRDKIKVIHDYLIENTKYDSNRSDYNIITYESNTAYGLLFEGYAICSGYSDAMQLFLNELNIPNIKIASKNHIWNLVYIEDNWYHLDLTWDDPLLEDGREIIDYGYFLITTEELYSKEDNQHYFDEDIYKEAMNNKNTQDY